MLLKGIKEKSEYLEILDEGTMIMKACSFELTSCVNVTYESHDRKFRMSRNSK